MAIASSVHSTWATEGTRGWDIASGALVTSWQVDRNFVLRDGDLFLGSASGIEGYSLPAFIDLGSLLSVSGSFDISANGAVIAQISRWRSPSPTTSP